MILTWLFVDNNACRKKTLQNAKRIVNALEFSGQHQFNISHQAKDIEYFIGSVIQWR